jgi:hypothetical protein
MGKRKTAALLRHLQAEVDEMRAHLTWQEAAGTRSGGLAPGAFATPAPRLYLDLLKRCLTRTLYPDPTLPPDADPACRITGRDWPAEAETMIGLRRLDNLEQLLIDVLREGISGDVIETGVWRGGATIFMRAVLAAYGVTDRSVWVADSFQGLPPPDAATYPADADLDLHDISYLKVSLEEVRANFARYGLLDNQVRFLPGWFRETLPDAPIGRLALMRLDGDLYESTIIALEALYPKLSPGGYVIIDDYGAVEACQQAVHDFRAAQGIDAPLVDIDGWGVWWRRQA